jgi:hypothetical protein
VIWTLVNYPSVGAVRPLSLLLVVALPFFIGLLIFHAVRWGATRDANYRVALRRSPLAEFISTNMVLAGVYPVATLLNGRWLSRWYPLASV